MVFPVVDPTNSNQTKRLAQRQWEYKEGRWEIATELAVGGNHYYSDTVPTSTLKGNLWTDSNTLITYTFNGSEWTEVGRGTVS